MQSHDQQEGQGGVQVRVYTGVRAGPLTRGPSAPCAQKNGRGAAPRGSEVWQCEWGWRDLRHRNDVQGTQVARFCH